MSDIKVTNLAYYKFLRIIGHVSFPDLLERRLCLLFRSARVDVEPTDKTSPVVLKVESSRIHEVGHFQNFCSLYLSASTSSKRC